MLSNRHLYRLCIIGVFNHRGGKVWEGRSNYGLGSAKNLQKWHQCFLSWDSEGRRGAGPSWLGSFPESTKTLVW